MSHRVVITGLGVITPVGTGKEEYWNNLLAGVSGVRRVEFPHVEMDQYRTQIAATVEDFEPSKFLLNGKKVKYMGRTSLFALAATKLALEDAGFNLSYEKGKARMSEVDPFKIGVILGAASGNMDIVEEAAAHCIDNKGPRRLSSLVLPYQLICTGASGVAIDC
mgnify:CR=1 FL=1